MSQPTFAVGWLSRLIRRLVSHSPDFKFNPKVWKPTYSILVHGISISCKWNAKNRILCQHSCTPGPKENRVDYQTYFYFSLWMTKNRQQRRQSGKLIVTSLPISIASIVNGFTGVYLAGYRLSEQYPCLHNMPSEVGDRPQVQSNTTVCTGTLFKVQ